MFQRTYRQTMNPLAKARRQSHVSANVKTWRWSRYYLKTVSRDQRQSQKCNSISVCACIISRSKKATRRFLRGLRYQRVVPRVETRGMLSIAPVIIRIEPVSNGHRFSVVSRDVLMVLRHNCVVISSLLGLCHRAFSLLLSLFRPSYPSLGHSSSTRLGLPRLSRIRPLGHVSPSIPSMITSSSYSRKRGDSSFQSTHFIIFYRRNHSSANYT